MPAAADWREDAAKRLKERKQGKRFKLAEGDNTIRVLPNAKGMDKAPFIEMRMHYGVGPKKKTSRCGKNMRGEGECWICDELIPKLKASAKASSRKMAEELEPKEEMALQIAMIDGGVWSGPKLFMPSHQLGNSILQLLSKAKRKIEDLERGYNLSVERTGTSLQTRYGAPVLDEEGPSEVPSEISDRLKTFKELLPQYDPAKQKAQYYGEDEDEDAGEDEDDTPAPKSKKVAPVEEDEDEPAPPPKKKPAVVEEEEDTPPPPKKKKAVVEDEDEPAPPPAKKKKPAPADDGDE